MAYFGDEWNKPDRSDHYAMQIAMEVRRVLHKNPSNVKMEHMKIPFSPVYEIEAKAKKKATAEEREEATKLAKSAWVARLGNQQKKTPYREKLRKPNDRG